MIDHIKRLLKIYHYTTYKPTFINGFQPSLDYENKRSVCRIAFAKKHFSFDEDAYSGLRIP